MKILKNNYIFNNYVMSIGSSNSKQRVVKPVKSMFCGFFLVYLETENEERFLARITESKKYEQKRVEYELLQKICKIGIPMHMPIDFGYCENKNEIYTLFTWVDGEDAGKVLPGLPFWKLFTFYIAGSAITSIVWAKYFAPECMDEIMKLNMDIVRWHDEMKNPIHIWYDKSLKYCYV
ncbi:MAG: hypothetical protein HDR12_00520 [Lachnospiraceae bacterium]|nr:hypothetical protein [Lachnospiraceae bacterium]